MPTSKTPSLFAGGIRFQDGSLQVTAASSTPPGGTSGQIQYNNGGTAFGGYTLVPLANGGTNADLSLTGGTSYVLRQSSVGAAITVGQLAASDLSNGVTGSGAVVLASAIAGFGTGTVQSVGLSGTAGQITVTGATPITGTGSWTLSLPNAVTIGVSSSVAGSIVLAQANAYTTTIQGAASANWTLTLPATAGSNTNILQTDGSGNTSWVAKPAGTVTSVSFTGDGTVLSSTPTSPITGSGTLTASLNTQSAHYVLAGPVSGAAVAPTFRQLAAADLSDVATSVGYVLRANGTSFVSAQLQYSDLGGSAPATAWSSISNAAGNLTLSNAAYTTTFNQTSAAAWLWANTTTATSGTTNASPLLEVAANYWTGAASAADTWTIGSSLAAGTNKVSTLALAHSGSTGAAQISIPASVSTNPVIVSGASAVGISVSSTVPLTCTGTASAAQDITLAAFNIGSSTVGAIMGNTTTAAEAMKIYSLSPDTTNSNLDLGAFYQPGATQTWPIVSIGSFAGNGATWQTQSSGTFYGVNIGGKIANGAATPTYSPYINWAPVSGTGNFICLNVAPTVNQSATVITNNITGTYINSNYAYVGLSGANVYTKQVTIAAVTNTAVNGTFALNQQLNRAGSPYTITNSVETSGHVVTLTTNYVAGANPLSVNDFVSISGLTNATWLNGVFAQVTATGGSSGAWTFAFADPTSHAAKVTGSDTGTVYANWVNYPLTHGNTAIAADTGTATQQATGTYTALKVAVTETSLTSATGHKLIDCYAGSAGTTAEFSVSNTGVTNTALGYQIGGAAASGAFLRGNATNFVSWQSAYANFYGDAVNISTTIAVQSTFYIIPTGLSSGTLSGFTWAATNNVLTCTQAGTYQITFGASCSCASSNTEFMVGVFKNGALVTGSQGHTSMKDPNYCGCASATNIVVLAASDTIQLAVKNDSNTTALLVEFANCSLVRIA